MGGGRGKNLNKTLPEGRRHVASGRGVGGRVWVADRSQTIKADNNNFNNNMTNVDAAEWREREEQKS